MREKENQNQRENECKTQKELTQDSTQKIVARVGMHMEGHFEKSPSPTSV